MEDMIKFLEKQIELEHKIVRVANKSVDHIKNVLVRELIRGISYDSEKHALLLTAIKGMLTEPTPLIEEEDSETIRESIEEHIELEAKAIETYKEVIDKTDNEKIKMILSEIYNDEKRHHALLLRVQKAIVDKETLTEEDLEEWLYKYAPFHGAPGG